MEKSNGNETAGIDAGPNTASRVPLICTYCGNRVFVTKGESPNCRICELRYVPDPRERQRYVPPNQIRASHRTEIRQLEADIWRLYVRPDLGIRHYGYFIRRPQGNILMDMQPLLTPDVEEWIAAAGGLKTIILSHPHYYGAMDEFSTRFSAPIRMHRSDREWPLGYPNIEYFDAPLLELDDEITVHHIPAQFEGGLCLLYRRHGGILFPGDTLMVSPGTGALSAWKSTPRQVPYTREEFRVIRERIAALDFSQLFASVRGEIRQQARQRALAFCAAYAKEVAVADRETQQRLLDAEREVPENETFRR